MASRTRSPEQRARVLEAQRIRRAKAKKAETMGTVTPQAGVARADTEKARADRRHGVQTNQAGDITREVLPGPIDAEHLAKYPLSPAGGTKATDRLARVEAAKAEKAAVKEWEATPESQRPGAGHRPATPNLDAMKAEATNPTGHKAKGGPTTRVTDQVVKAWIATHQKANPTDGIAAGLAAFRASGQSCNQARFRGLWAEVKAG